MLPIVAKPGKLWRILFAVLLLGAAVLALLPSDGQPWFPGQDKVQHAFAYLIFYVTGWLGYPGPRVYWRLHAGLLFYGLVIESLQSLTGYRYPELADLLANAGGLALGNLLVIWLLRRQYLLPGGRIAPGHREPG